MVENLYSMISQINDYNSILTNLIEKIRVARLKAVISANAQLLGVYWEIGKVISEKESSQGWGAKIVESLSLDLKKEFPDIKGFSTRNLRYMRDFYSAYPHLAILQNDVAKFELPENPSTEMLQDELAKLNINLKRNCQYCSI